MRLRLVALVALAIATTVPVMGSAAETDQDGNLYRQEWIATDDPLTTMHADVVRSSSLNWAVEQPVILVATPYGNHAGQADWSPGPPAEQNGRFSDFLALSGALEKGYTYVVVDLPGFGGSSGCGDLGGPLERAAVKRAVEWAASQPWSTGKVALFGKSYDGWTGLMGIAEQPQGLAAVVALEPVYSPYVVDFANGVRNLRSFLMPAVYAEIEAYPGTLNDSPEYQANSVIRPHCFAASQVNWMNDDASAGFWQERNLPADSVGAPTPLFMTQGLLETNTVSRGAFSYFNSLGHDGNRAWYGQFDHIRAWERDGSGRLASGLKGFAGQVMRFLDLHLRGIDSEIDDPVISVQDNFGRYRAEPSWPPPDADSFVTELRTGTYVDADTGQQDDIWSSSAPLDHDVWLAGEPTITVDVATTAPRANFTAQLFDVHPDGQAIEVSRDAHLVRGVGTTTLEFPLMGQDWVFEAGHRIAVLLARENNSWFVHIPSGAVVTVENATITLPLLTTDRTVFLGGQVTNRLSGELQRWDFAPIGPWSTVPFDLPPAIDTGAR